MITLENLTKDSSSEAYLLKAGGLNILILGRPDYSSLQFFRPSGLNSISRESSDSLNSPYKLDLDYLKNLDINTLNLILVCDYKSLLIIPYIIRIKQIPILATQPMIELGKILCLNILEILHNENRFCEQTDFLKENETFDLFEQEHDINLQNYANIYSTHQLSTMLLNCKKVNPGQNYQYGDLIMTPYHTGASIGQCMWNIKSKLAQNSILVILNGSNQTWRHCQTIEIERVSNITDLIIGKSLISNNPQMSVELTQFKSRVEGKLRSNQNVHLHFKSNFDILDTIEIINYHLYGVYKQIVVLDSTFISFTKLTNSSVEYLSAKRGNKIYNDPPQYPFSDIDGLLQKGLLSAGGLVEIASKEKVPVKEVLLRFKPAVYLYMKQYYQIGVCGEDTDIEAPDFRFRTFQFKKWMDIIKPKRVLSFSRDIGNVIEAREVNIKFESYKNFEYKNSVNMLKQYQLLNGTIVSEFQKKYRIVPKDWAAKISNILKTQGVSTTFSLNTLITNNSKLSLIDYTFHIISSNAKEAQKIVQILISM